jgi:AICAR transformylase/IMP cyclohydrolase PurH
MDKQVFRRTTVQYILCQQQENHELEYGQNEHQNNITTQKCNKNCLQHPDTKLDTLQLLL